MNIPSEFASFIFIFFREETKIIDENKFQSKFWYFLSYSWIETTIKTLSLTTYRTKADKFQKNQPLQMEFSPN